MWILTTTAAWLDLEHGERAQVFLSFTDGFQTLHVVPEDGQLMLVREDGQVLRHWPVEVIAALASRLDNLRVNFASSLVY